MAGFFAALPEDIALEWPARSVVSLNVNEGIVCSVPVQ